MPGSLHTVDMAASGITAGIREVGYGPVVKLVSAPTRCKRVWVGRPEAATGKVWIGTQLRQNRLLDAGDMAGFYIHIDDASKIYLISEADSSVEYWIEH